jgi:uncharacterized membrane protein
MDLVSTWLATPTLQLEANPIARWLGWRRGWVVNALASVALALIPLAAVSVTTTSLMVAARNAQSAWIVRSMGEFEYRSWIAARYRAAGRGVFLVSLLMNTGLTALVGAGLMVFSRWQLLPGLTALVGAGLGVVVYALAVGLYTGMAMRRAARGEGNGSGGDRGRERQREREHDEEAERDRER